MNYVREQVGTFRRFAASAAALAVLTLAGAAVPARAQTYTVLTVIPTGSDFAQPNAQ
jgi:hypothetical protein